jgi:hypothetical protein
MPLLHVEDLFPEGNRPPTPATLDGTDLDGTVADPDDRGTPVSDAAGTPPRTV